MLGSNGRSPSPDPLKRLILPGPFHYDLPMPAPPTTGNHFIVCGDGSLAYRIASELTSRYGEDVVVVLPDPAANHGPQISALPGVTVLSHPILNSEAFTDAGIASARGLALVARDDLVNFHAALCADELSPGLRIVVAAFNRRLGQHIRGFFRDCTVLSSSETASPSFVSAAIGLPRPRRGAGAPAVRDKPRRRARWARALPARGARR